MLFLIALLACGPAEKSPTIIAGINVESILLTDSAPYEVGTATEEYPYETVDWTPPDTEGLASGYLFLTGGRVNSIELEYKTCPSGIAAHLRRTVGSEYQEDLWWRYQREAYSSSKRGAKWLTVTVHNGTLGTPESCTVMVMG